MRSVTAVVLLATLVLTGCGSKKGEPPPWSPTPRPSVATPTPTPSSPSQEELFAEAERVFLASQEIRARYEQNGDFSGFPQEELSQYMLPDYLAQVKVIYAFMAEKQWKAQPGANPIITYKPAPLKWYKSSKAALHVCSDTRPVPLYAPDGTLASEGTVYDSYVFFDQDTDGSLKILWEQYEEVPECTVD